MKTPSAGLVSRLCCRNLSASFPGMSARQRCHTICLVRGWSVSWSAKTVFSAGARRTIVGRTIDQCRAFCFAAHIRRRRRRLRHLLRRNCFRRPHFHRMCSCRRYFLGRPLRQESHHRCAPIYRRPSTRYSGSRRRCPRATHRNNFRHHRRRRRVHHHPHHRSNNLCRRLHRRLRHSV